MTASDTQPIVLKDLRVETLGGTPIVRDIGFSIAPGKVLGLVGESGSGKSTIGKALLGYAAPGLRIAGGRFLVGGTDILGLSEAGRRGARGRLVAYVPQDASSALNPAVPIRRQMIERLRIGADRMSDAQAETRIRETLDSVGLPTGKAFLDRYPGELSGGQLQRVGLTVAIVTHPRLLVLDEPTTALDASNRASVLELVSRLNAELNMSSLYISHDLGVISAVADEVMVLYAGQTVEAAPSAPFFDAPAHPYSQALLTAMPTTRMRKELRGIRGRVPPLAERAAITGCLFAARCDLATPECEREMPPLTPFAAGVVRCLHAGRDRKPAVARPEATPDTAGPALLSVRNLSAHYGAETVLKDISFDLRPGGCTALVGESGSGKSTLSRCLIGLHEDMQGEVLLDGTPVPRRIRARPTWMHRDMQYIFQDPYGSLHPRRSIGASLAAALRLTAGPDARPAREAVPEVLARVALPPAMADRFPSELSGGERQRVAIARALIGNPRLLICDEVTSALDVSVQASILDLLQSLMREDLAILFVTHDLGVVRSISDRVIVLNQGLIVEEGATARVIGAPSHPYTQSLLSKVLEVA